MAYMASNGPKYPKTYLKEWRSYKGLTQKQVVSRLIEIGGDGEVNDKTLRIPTTDASLSRIENGEQPYTQASLEALAVVYETTSDQLLGRNPLKEGKVITLPVRATPEQIEQIQKMIAVIVGTGTDG